MQNKEHLIKNLQMFFSPKSVAIVGASKKSDKSGHIIFSNFVQNKRRGIFKGEIYPVNPSEDSILGYKCYPSVKNIPDDVESVVIVVPAKAVVQVLKEAADKGVDAAIIISAGFSEIGNHKGENTIKEIAKKSGIRILGPNCIGVFDSYEGMDTLFLPETKVLKTGDVMVATPRPMAGYTTLISQSGGFGVAALDYLTGQEIGISKFVSFGNKSDVNESEMLYYINKDENTRVVLLYVESIENGREFLEVAKEFTKEKPIVALKSGLTKAGARAASSHTGALSGSDEIYDAAFIQTGVIRTQNMCEFFNVGKAFVFQPPAEGRNVAILTDVGGPGVMAADESELRGINIGKLSSDTLAKFQKLKESKKIPSFSTNTNPIDLTGSATSEMFEHSLKVLLDDKNINGIIIIGIHHLPAIEEDYVDVIGKISIDHQKPIVACDIGETEMAKYIRSRFEKLGIPAYDSPEEAAHAMAALVEYGIYLKSKGCLNKYINHFKELPITPK
ncbi:MAG: CoA-binding protein [Candidatus Bathyarchaeota archaeon]|nr:CoA-binding protein [Candidatus Bathyarchaeota archaeon]